MASHNDSAILAADALFQGRVRAALAAACTSIWNEAPTTAYHFARVRLSTSIMNAIEIQSGNMPPWVLRFTLAVSTDASVLADALAGPPIVASLTTANVDAQQAAITDAHIDAAVSSQFNSFLYPA